MNLKQSANNTIPKPQGIQETFYQNGDTADIIKTIVYSGSVNKEQLKFFVPYIEGKDLEDTSYKLWKFVKDYIRYSEDPIGKQDIKSPAQVWDDKVCDCKGYSVFIQSALNCLGYDCYYKFISTTTEDPLHHVYVVVPDKKKTRTMPLTGYSVSLTAKRPTNSKRP